MAYQRLKSSFRPVPNSGEDITTYFAKRQYLKDYIHEVSIGETLGLITSVCDVLFQRRLEKDRSNQFTPFPHFDLGFRDTDKILADVDVVLKTLLRFFAECHESDKHLFGPILKEYIEMKDESSGLMKIFLVNGLTKYGIGMTETDRAFYFAHLLEGYKVDNVSAVTKIIKIRKLINPQNSNKDEITRHLHALVVLLFDITFKFFEAYKQLTSKNLTTRNGQSRLIDPMETWKLILDLLENYSPPEKHSSPANRNMSPSMSVRYHHVPLFMRNVSNSSHVTLNSSNRMNFPMSMPIQSHNFAPSPTQMTYRPTNLLFSPPFRQSFSSIVSPKKSSPSKEETNGTVLVNWKSINEDRVMFKTIFDGARESLPEKSSPFPCSPLPKQGDDSPSISSSPGLLDYA